MNDPLERAVAAFRVEQDCSDSDARATRARLMRSVRRREARHKLSLGAAVVAALVATNSTTWAWSTGRLDPVLERVRELVRAPSDEATSSSGRSRRSPPRARPEEAAPREVSNATRPLPATDVPSVAPGPLLAPPPIRSGRDTADALEPGRSIGADRTPRVRPPVRSTRRPDTVTEAPREAEATAPPLDEDRAAFAAAHRLHFQGGSAQAALAAWDRYVSGFPDGRFVPEARFNRAATLLRLHRDDEAREALRPFAEGAFDGIRAREARELLEALDEGTVRR